MARRSCVIFLVCALLAVLAVLVGMTSSSTPNSKIVSYLHPLSELMARCGVSFFFSAFLINKRSISPIPAVMASGVIVGRVGAVSVIAGYLRTCAVVQGKVGCWGYGQYGNLGRGDTLDWGSATGQMTTLLPIPFSSQTLIVDQISTSLAGYDHTCVLFTNKQVFYFARKKKKEILFIYFN